MTDAYIGIGSNMGDRAQYLIAARDALAVLPQTQLIGQSRVYQTEPVGPIEQEAYFNAVVCLATELTPMRLLEGLLEIERGAGRERVVKWGPRTLDLDVLLYGEQVIVDDDLTVPHPHLHERGFVLYPLCDIAPNVAHPMLGVPVRDLRESLNEPAPVTVDVAGW